MLGFDIYGSELNLLSLPKLYIDCTDHVSNKINMQ